MRSKLLWTALILLFLFGVSLVVLIAANAQPAVCDHTLWNHIYHRERLHVQQACVTLEGAWQDATNGKTADGCRHEKDGDGHCWLKLDEGQDGQPGTTSQQWQDTVRGGVIGPYLNPVNMAKQSGNLVIEPICFYKTTQLDAIPFCKNWHQQIALPPIGSHVRVTGAWVLDAEHGHEELHPVTSIEVLK